MKKAFAIMLSIFTILLSNTVAFAVPFSINSQTYVVMEAKSGQVLLSQGADTKKYPASITKVLTCGIALHGVYQCAVQIEYTNISHKVLPSFLTVSAIIPLLELFVYVILWYDGEKGGEVYAFCVCHIQRP